MREAFILLTYFNELNKTVYSMLSAKNVFVLTESRLRADGFCTPRFLFCYNQEGALMSGTCFHIIIKR